MSDNLNIQLDGSQIVKGVDDVLAALREFKAAIAEFSRSDPTGRVRAEAAALATSATTVVQSMEKSLGSVKGVIDKAMNEAATSAKAGGKKIAKAVADGLEEQDVSNTVRAQVKKLQAEYERALNQGWNLKIPALQQLKLQGVSLSPDDRLRLTAEMQADANRTFQMRQKFQAQEQAQLEEQQAIVARAAKGLIKLREGLAAEDIAQQQRAANEAFRNRQNFIRSEQAQLEEQQAIVARAAKGLAKLRAALAEEASAARLQALGGTASYQLQGAFANPAGNYSALTAGGRFKNSVTIESGDTEKVIANTKALGDNKIAAAALRAEQQLLAERSRDVHSALRGVSGAAGALWLTYGAILPLLAAFTAGRAVRDSIKDWSEFEYQLKFVQAVAEDTSVSVDKMMASVSGTATQAGVSPIEAAKGLRLLAQAGLDTTQALQALPTVLAVAKVGELDMATASETLTGSTYALGVGLDNIGRVGDVFVKAAAISNTSVGSIAESMKTASTIAQQYKLSVEDIGTALVALGKRNITGGAAGTAFRNLLDEFAAPRGEQQKISKQLGLTLFDPIKNDAKDFFGRFIPELREKLKVFDPQSQVFIMNRLTNNRGAKALSALLGMTDEDLAQIHSQLDKSTGMAQRALIELNDSTKGRFDQFSSQLAASLSLAASQGSEPLKASLEGLREVVASPEFVAAVRGLVAAFSGLVVLSGGAAKFLMSDAGMITSAAAAVGGAMYLMQGGARGAAVAIAETGAAATATAAASGAAASGAMGLLAAFARFTIITAIITGALIAVGMLYEKLTEKGPIDKAISFTDNLIAKEREYQNSLDDSIRKLKERMGLAVGPTKDQSNLESLLAAAKKDYDEKQAKADLPQNQSFFAVQKQAMDALVKWKQLQQEMRQFDNERMNSVMKEMEQRDLQRQAAQKEMERLKGALGSGTKHFNEIDPNAAYNNAKRDIENQLREQEMLRVQADRDEKYAEDKAKFRYDVGVTDWKMYQQELLSIQQDAQGKRMASLLKELEIEKKAQETLQNLASMRDPKSQPGQAAANDLEAKRLEIEKTSAAISNAQHADEKRRDDALKSLLQPSVEIVRNAEKETAVLQNNFDQEMRRAQLKANSLALSERELYVQQEIARSTSPMEDQLTKLIAARAQLEKNFDFSGDDTLPEVVTAYLNLSFAILSLQKAMAAAKTTASNIANEAFDAQKINEIAKGLNSGIADAILEGGREGAHKLRQTLADELLRKPFRMVIQALLQPVTNGLANIGYNLIGGIGNSAASAMGMGNNLFGAASFGNSALGSVGTNMMSSVGSAFGFGGTGAMFTTASTEGLAGPVLSKAALDGTMAFGANSVSGAAALGGEGLMSGMGAALSAIPVWGWIAAAVLAMAAFAGKGETRSGGQYAYSFDGTSVLNARRGTTQSASGIGATFLEGPSGGDANQYAARTALNSTVGVINSMFQNLGVDTRVTGFQGGYESSDKGRGGVFTGGTLTGGTTFGESGRGDNYQGTLYEKTSSNSPSIQDAFQNFITDQKQSVIQALQAYAQTAGSDLPNSIRELLTNVDAEKLADGDAQGLIDKINAVIDGVKAFWSTVNAAPVAQLKNLSFDVAATLIKLSGGIDQFRTNLNAFVQNFYSATERRSATASSIGATLRKAGLNVTDQEIASGTRDQFRALAESIDVTTDKGSVAYTALMSVADAFASITEGAGDSKDALDKQLNDWKDTVDQIKQFTKSLADLRTSLQLGDLSPLNPVTKYQASRTNLDSLYDKALHGDKDAQDSFSSAAQDFLKQSQGVNASSDAYSSDYNYVQGLINSLSTAEGPALTDAQQHVIDVQNQLDAIDNVKTAVEGSGIDIVKALGDLNTTANAIVTAVQQVVIPGGITGGGGTTTGGGDGLTTGSQGSYYVDEGGIHFMPGGGGGSIIDPMPDVMGYASGGFNPGGWSLVGEDGPELVNFSAPGRVYTAAQTRAAMGGMSDELLVQLIAHVAALREEQAQHTNAIVHSNVAAHHKAAETIVDGTHEAVGRSEWRGRLERGARTV